MTTATFSELCKSTSTRSLRWEISQIRLSKGRYSFYNCYRLNPEKAAQNPKSKIPNPPIQNPKSKIQNQEFLQAMSGLWNQYRGLMVQRMEVLQKAKEAIQGDRFTDSLRQETQQAAHKLAGVLGMFDLDTGTQFAREIEQILANNSELSPAQHARAIALIQQLDELLDLAEQKNNNQPTSLSSNTRLLLIDSDVQLGSQLQQLAASVGMAWDQVATIDRAKNYLQTTSPDLVVFSVDDVGTRSENLSLLTELATRTPPVPAIALSSADGLIDRVTVARAGGRGFLVKPATAIQVWEAASQLLQNNKNFTKNILVVDDDPVILAALRSILEPWGMRMVGLNEPLRFWSVLQSTNPDLLILDVEMPEINGIELCQAVRTDPKWQGLPILFLTAHREMEIVQQVFAAGADDYVVKPVVGAELLTRILHRLERNQLLQSFSLKDPLTGLKNQPQSNRELQKIIDLALLNRHSVCLVVLSVGELRQINIQYGHEAGNQVLQRWSSVFQSAFRSGEVLGYWGHGEFIIGVSGLTKVEVSDRLQDILTSLRQQIFTADNGDRFQATCYFAVVEYPNDGLTVQSLYQAASNRIFTI